MHLSHWLSWNTGPGAPAAGTQAISSIQNTNEVVCNEQNYQVENLACNLGSHFTLFIPLSVGLPSLPACSWQLQACYWSPCAFSSWVPPLCIYDHSALWPVPTGRMTGRPQSIGPSGMGWNWAHSCISSAWRIPGEVKIVKWAANMGLPDDSRHCCVWSLVS